MGVEINAKPLEGWLIAEQAAQILGLTKQSVHNLIRNGEFQNVRYVGFKPTYLLEETEVRKLKRIRDEEAAERAADVD
jgi:hypothetical protein